MKISGIGASDIKFRGNVQHKPVDKPAAEKEANTKKNNHDTLKTLGIIAVSVGALLLIKKGIEPPEVARGARNSGNRNGITKEDVAEEVIDTIVDKGIGKLEAKGAVGGGVIGGAAARESSILDGVSHSESSILDDIGDAISNIGD